MASQPSAGDRTPQTPPAPSSPSVEAAKSCSYVQTCVVLVDWWLERKDGKVCIAGLHLTPQMRNCALSSRGKSRSAARVFKGAIAKRRDLCTVETVDGYVVLVKGILNDSRMRENGFSDKVCRSFRYGFPVQWNKLFDSNMEHINGHLESPANSADEALVEHYLEKFMSDSFASSKGYSFAENYLGSFRNLAVSDLGEPGTPKCCKTSVKTDNASGKNEGRTLRSGRVLGGPLSAPMTGGNKRKRTQQKASNNKGLSKEALSPTADLTSHENMVGILHFDGAAKGNPGKAGAGAVLMTEDGTVISHLREGLGVATNNVAVYRGLVLGLRYAIGHGFERITAHGDSQLVCNQVNGIWQTKNQNMMELCQEVRRMKENFVSFEISHVPREWNSEADRQANIGITLATGAVSEERGDGL